MRTRCRLLIASAAALAAAPALAQETREYDLPTLEEQVKEERSLTELVKIRFKASNRFVGLADFGDYRANSYQPEARLKVTVPLASDRKRQPFAP